MEESKIEKRLKDAIKRIGGMAFKFVSPGNTGVPDRLVLLPGGRIVFIELKASKGKLSELQKVRRKQIRDLGFRVECLNSIEKIDKFIEEVKYETVT